MGFLIGLEIPLLIRMNTRWRGDLKDNLGDVLSLDYVGALIGASYLGIRIVATTSLVDISLLLSGLNVAVALLSMWLLRGWLKSPRLLFLLTVITTVIIAWFIFQAPKLIEEARQRLYASPIQHHEQTKIQDIVFTGHGHRLSLYLNGRLQFDSEDEFIYHELLVHPAASALPNGPKRVLVLGAAMG